VIAQTPKTPYYAVIFTSVRTSEEDNYTHTAHLMDELAKLQPGYLGIESAREQIGITVSYWKDLESIRRWKQQVDHQLAQKLGREKWYSQYKTRICLVERDYGYGL
jgi:heme-degrading monooxygenase HmoA